MEKYYCSKCRKEVKTYRDCILYEWRSWEYSNLPISASGTRVFPIGV